MICENCKLEIPEGNYCVFCGNKISKWHKIRNMLRNEIRFIITNRLDII